LDSPSWTDDRTTVAEMRAAVRRFVEARDWGDFHTPKNLSMSIAIEAAEIMEHFQWLTAEQSAGLVADLHGRAQLADELADVLIYCLGLANQSEIDLSRAVEDQLARNEDRFPPAYKP
jgi:NTP pyrophosphatase (non-canonical NTP hydrolase)